MGATNSTTNYSLSQFISTDKPAWLQDYNGDMLKIDVAIKAAKTAADSAQSTADAASSASGTNTAAITALQTTVGGLNTSVTNLQSSVNTIQALIGNGTPTTTDRTIIGAINEINAYNHLRKVGRVDISLATTQKADWDTIWTYLNSQFSTYKNFVVIFDTGTRWNLQGPAADGAYRGIILETDQNAHVAFAGVYCANGNSKTSYTVLGSNTVSITDTTNSSSSHTYVDVYVWE